MNHWLNLIMLPLSLWRSNRYGIDCTSSLTFQLVHAQQKTFHLLDFSLLSIDIVYESSFRHNFAFLIGGSNIPFLVAPTKLRDNFIGRCLVSNRREEEGERRKELSRRDYWFTRLRTLESGKCLSPFSIVFSSQRQRKNLLIGEIPMPMTMVYAVIGCECASRSPGLN